MFSRSIATFVMVNCCICIMAKPKYDSATKIVLNAETQPLSSEDQEIEEIANRDYDTVHGRILAVNMAHMEKRRQEMQDEKQNKDSVYQDIEEINKKKHLELYQGDIVMTKEMEEYVHMPNMTMTKRNAISSKTYLWLSRIIPYHIPNHMMHIKKNLMIAIAELEKHTCLRFPPYSSALHRDYITFSKNRGCSSTIGRYYVQPGKQSISLGDGCNFPGTIIHEMVHAIGFWHEQSRSDRDKYVEIKWENIAKGFEDQFDKYTTNNEQLGVDYDYQSIMHYSRTAFTKNQKPTIVAIGKPANFEFGTKDDRLSTKDIIEINALYDCKAKQYGWTRWSAFTPCNKKCYKKRERYCYHPGKDMQYCGGNVNIYGIESEYIKCTKMECLARNSINGHWGAWSAWSSCSVKCDDGGHSRTRQCNNPPKSKYGKPCPGKSKEEKLCSVRRCKPGPYDTDFDNPKRPMGMWRNMPGTKIKWTRNKYFTPTAFTGPIHDHTLGNKYGYYLYVESSYPVKKNQQAKLVSKTIPFKQGGRCLKFYYMMYGSTIGSLKVILHQRKKRIMYRLFYKKGDQGQTWKFASATLDVKGQFELQFIATVGNTGYSDIAIDDIYINDGKCSCQDKFVSCIKWSEIGECLKNEKWMKKNCPRSCSVCITCEDIKKVQCPIWAKMEECKKNPKYMNKKCRKSCGICRGVKCEDNRKIQCPLWAKKGECNKNPKYMNKYCRKSCGICRD